MTKSYWSDPQVAGWCAVSDVLLTHVAHCGSSTLRDSSTALGRHCYSAAMLLLATTDKAVKTARHPAAPLTGYVLLCMLQYDDVVASETQQLLISKCINKWPPSILEGCQVDQRLAPHTPATPATQEVCKHRAKGDVHTCRACNQGTNGCTELGQLCFLVTVSAAPLVRELRLQQYAPFLYG